ncbi:MAG: hypothetical protein CMJ46_11540 [Planctomyces sp.]|nr:hypothetical protein [Planctomyces sp.]
MIIVSPINVTRSLLDKRSVKSLLMPAKKYCAMRSDINAEYPRLRSNDLKAAAKKVFSDSCHTRFSEGMASAFNLFCERRLERLDDNDGEGDAHVDDNSCDHLLLVNWRHSLFDGVCSPVTGGFIDNDGMPGWDSWIALVNLELTARQHALLCWTPEKLVESVDDALTLDAAECMSWLRWNRTKFEIVGWGQRSDE